MMWAKMTKTCSRRKKNKDKKPRTSVAYNLDDRKETVIGDANN